MRPSIEVLDSNDELSWAQCLAELPEQLRDIHFSLSYHLLYKANGDGEPRMFRYRDGDRMFLYPFLFRPVPAGLIAGEWYDISSVYGYTGPLSNTMDPDFLSEADDCFIRYCRAENIVTEFVRFNPLMDNHRFLASASGMDIIRLRDYIAVDIAERDEDQFGSFEPRNRTSIRKAIKAGLIVTDSADFNDFVKIYLDNMRQLKAASLYHFSDQFFASLETLVKKDGLYLSAVYNGVVVGVALFLIKGRYAHYFLASATPAGRSLAAGNLLLHEGIRQCRSAGVRRLHLGGGLTNDPKDPLFVFKRGFSNLTVPYFIGRRIHRHKEFDQLDSAWVAKYPQFASHHTNQLQRYRIKSY